MKCPIISQQLFIPHPFKELDPSDQMMMEESEYEHHVEWFNNCTDTIFERITYLSDGLKISGIISRPLNSNDNQQYPVILYNRGGVAESGKITVRILHKRIYPLVKLGYVVIASQYRGSDGSEGVDEVGGNDIDDIIALLPVVQSLPYVDYTNMFMIGFSRGAVNTYRVLQKNILPIKACAILSGLSDLFSLEKCRPEFVPLLEHFIPQYNKNRIAELTKRSAIHWAQDLSVPLLLIHGEKDDMVDVNTTKNLAHELAKYNKTYKLIIYPETDHSLDPYNDQAVIEIDNWFKQYKN